MAKTSNSFGRTMLGLILSLFLTISLITASIFLDLRLSVLNGNSASEVLKNDRFFSTIQDVAHNEVKSQLVGAGLSGEMVDKVFSYPFVETLSTEIIDSITETGHIGSEKLTEVCIKVAENIADDTIDKAIDAASNTNAAVTINNIINSSPIEELERTSNMPVKSMLSKGISKATGISETDFSLPENNPKNIGETLKQELTGVINPLIEQVVENSASELDKAINNNSNINEATTSAHDLLKITDMAIKYFNISIWIISAFVLFIFILELLIYHRESFRAFKNLAVCALINSIIILVFAFSVTYLSGFLSAKISSDSFAVSSAKEFVNYNLGNIRDVSIWISLGSFAITIFAVIISTILHNKYDNT